MSANKKGKYIFVLGGVMSGVGKGVTVSAIGRILQARGYRVNPLKIDPYLNVDAGTMNPIEHGEVFVLDSGLECDQDMGNYERFLELAAPAENYMTSGMVYKYVIDKERALGYAGKCVDPVPYISAEILRRIAVSEKKTKADISIIEIGGTVGEYQNAIFIEAARILKLQRPQDVVFVLVSYLPVPTKIGEMKTKPTQYAVRTLNSYGVHPDFIIARSDRAIDKPRREKISFSCNVPAEQIISAPDVDSIYDIPLNFEEDGLSTKILRALSLKPKTSDLHAWQQMVKRRQLTKRQVKIGLVGKYFQTGDFVLSDVYLSVIESLKHAGVSCGCGVNIDWLNSADFEGAGAKNLKRLADYDGILVPGGFGSRGIEGILSAIKYAREKKIPYLGLCYGMQLAVIEYARNVLAWRRADTTEIDPKTPYPVIDIMTDQKKLMAEQNYGGTMRLGSYPAKLRAGTLARQLYGAENISERHRHRYEVNPRFIADLEKQGLVFSGTSPDGQLMEIVELPEGKHPFFIGSQFHPEFQSWPLKPHPLFVGFISSAIKHQGSKR